MLVARWLSYEKGNRFLCPIFFFFDRKVGFTGGYE